jgi:hypothetical protein
MGQHSRLRAQNRAKLIRAMRAFAARTKGPITTTRFCRAQHIGLSTVHLLFPRGFSGLLAAAGVTHRRSQLKNIASDDLLADLHRVARTVGHLPGDVDLRRLGRFCRMTYYNRFGLAAGLRSAYHRWCRSKGVRPFEAPPMGAAANVGKPSRRPYRPSASPDFWLAEPINFRGLSHVPTTEAGVIHLFGLLAPETGLVIQHIGTAFPDCRALKREGDRWRKIAVEFEFRASNFKAHGHDAKQCDLIVCWENDWPGCPVKVMELKSMMKEAMGKN